MGDVSRMWMDGRMLFVVDFVVIAISVSDSFSWFLHIFDIEFQLVLVLFVESMMMAGVGGRRRNDKNKVREKGESK